MPAPTSGLLDASVRALVFDPHAATRIGVGVLLRHQPWVARCVLAADRAESVALAERHKPDVAIVDISNAGPFASSYTAPLRAAHPAMSILLSSRCRPTLDASPASLGAVGFLPAGCSCAEIIAAVRGALLHETVVPPQSLAPSAAGLTDREREVLALLSTGATNREIAAQLHVGAESVKKHATALYRKLGVRNRTEAAQRAASLLAA